MPVIDLGSVVGPQGPQGATGATGAQGIQGNPGPNQVTDQTSTNLNGVLFGNQSRVTVKPVDSDPTANSTNLVSSGGTDKAIKGRVPVTGMGKNLLDNAYFVGGGSQLGDGIFPINQRGQTQYSGSGKKIDRWGFGSAGGEVELLASGVKITVTAGSQSFSQSLSTPTAALYGRTVTVSALTAGGDLYYETGTLPNSAPSSTTTYISKAIPNVGSLLVVYAASTSRFNVSIANSYSSSQSVTIAAMKLELGTEQTLCHNEGTAEAPVWVLNEIPDYETEWNKCNKYLRVYYRDSTYAKSRMLGARFSHESRDGYANFAFPIDPPMASTPTVTNNGALGVRTLTTATNIANITFSFPSTSKSVMNIRAESTALTAGTLYWVDTLNTGSTIILSAEL